MVANHRFIDIVHRCGQQGLPLEGVYRRIQDRELFLIAYHNLYSNAGALTKGANPEDTMDGMSMARIDTIIDRLKHNAYHWTPVRRTYIDKKSGGKRSLGIVSWSDKLLQEVIRIVLEAYYEPRFSDHSHGFRPERGCHTALQAIRYGWTGTKWFVEGDIRRCYDTINPDILLKILARDIKDNRFLKLIRTMLKAGYLENWQYQATYSGVPQGSGVSPILANILLSELDRRIEKELLPLYNRGNQRRPNLEYQRVKTALHRAKKKEDWERAKTLKKTLSHLPSKDPNDPTYRRLYYCRYADDVLFGFNGPRREAEEIKAQLGQFLHAIGLEMSESKTLITHAATERARFLNYDMTVAKSTSRPNVNYKIKLLVPAEVKTAWLRKYSLHGKAHHRPELLNLTDFEIVQTYGLEFRGIVNYYSLAENVSGVFHHVKWVAITSACKTIANKRKTTVNKIYRKYYHTSASGLKALIVEHPNPNNPEKPYRAQLGERPIKRQATTVITDLIEQWSPRYSTAELTTRLLAQKCELCNSTEQIQVHHIRKLADLKKRYRGRKEKPVWVRQMIARRRKTLVVCVKCHRTIHAGTYDGPKVKQG